MAFKSRKNFAISQLAASIDDSQLSLEVKTGEGVKFPASDFWVAVEEEVMLCSSRTGDVFTITRGEQGTSGAAHASGKRCYNAITTGDVGDVEDKTKRNSLTFPFYGTVQVNAVFGDGWYPSSFGLTPKKLTIVCQVAPTSDVKVDILKDGAVQSKEVTLPSGQNYATGAISALSYSETERLGFKITQGTDGAGLAVILIYEVT